MSPGRGGEADKFGGRYEGRWTVAALLKVLVGHAVSIIIEQRGEGGKGVEFVLTRPDGVVEGHQVKRQRGNQNNWTLRSLRDEEVLPAVVETIGSAGAQALCSCGISLALRPACYRGRSHSSSGISVSRPYWSGIGPQP